MKAHLVKAAVVAAGLGLAGTALAQDMRIVVVSHGQASDPFWSVVKNGVDQAATDLGVTVEYRAPDTFDMVQMGQLIDAAVASQPDGLVVSVPDAEALGDSIRNAVASGIPVVSMNSGSDVREELGVAVHVGQTEYEAGLGGGKRMKEAGVTKAICVNQEVGNVALDLRCEGFTEGLGGAVEVVAVSMDPTEVGNAVKAASLRQSRHQRRAHPRAGRLGADHGGARGGRDAGQGQVRHLRSVARRAPGDR